MRGAVADARLDALAGKPVVLVRAPTEGRIEFPVGSTVVAVGRHVYKDTESTLGQMLYHFRQPSGTEQFQYANKTGPTAGGRNSRSGVIGELVWASAVNETLPGAVGHLGHHASGTSYGPGYSWIGPMVAAVFDHPLSEAEVALVVSWMTGSLQRAPGLVPRPGPSWVLEYSTTVSPEGALELPQIGSRARSPLIPVPPASRMNLTYDFLVPAGGSDKIHLASTYRAADGSTPVESSGGWTGNGYARTALTPGKWEPGTWGMLLGNPEIRWVTVSVECSAAYGTPGTLMKNFHLTFTP